MARGMYFRKLRFEEYMAPSNLCLYQYPPEVSLCSRNRISVSSGKGMNSGYGIRSSYLLDFSFLHHSCRRVFTVFYVATM